MDVVSIILEVLTPRIRGGRGLQIDFLLLTSARTAVVLLNEDTIVLFLESLEKLEFLGILEMLTALFAMPLSCIDAFESREVSGIALLLLPKVVDKSCLVA